MTIIRSEHPLITDAQKAVRGLALVAWTEWEPETAAARWAEAVRENMDSDGGSGDAWMPAPEPVAQFVAGLLVMERAYRTVKADRRRRERARIGYAMLAAERGDEFDAPMVRALHDAGGPLVLWRLADRATNGLGMVNRPSRSVELTDAAWQLIAEKSMVALLEDAGDARVAGSASLLALTAAGALEAQWAAWRASVLVALLTSGSDEDCRDPLLLLLAGGLSKTGIATSELHAIAQSAPIYTDPDLQPFVANHPAATTEVHHALGRSFARAAHWRTPCSGPAAFAARCARILGPNHPVTAAGLAAWPAAQS
ncbi:MAG: hypothetical protein H7305_05570 [Gemmatimonadaceae bacterium]|nr:hypothetical protein [Gemmatimonadaceae bacterium]